MFMFLATSGKHNLAYGLLILLQLPLLLLKRILQVQNDGSLLMVFIMSGLLFYILIYSLKHILIHCNQKMAMKNICFINPNI